MQVMSGFPCNLWRNPTTFYEIKPLNVWQASISVRSAQKCVFRFTVAALDCLDDMAAPENYVRT